MSVIAYDPTFGILTPIQLSENTQKNKHGYAQEKVEVSKNNKRCNALFLFRGRCFEGTNIYSVKYCIRFLYIISFNPQNHLLGVS